MRLHAQTAPHIHPSNSSVRHVLALVAACLWPAVVLAQPAGSTADPRAAVWGAFTLTVPQSGGTLESSYRPPLRLGGTLVSSSASQTLGVDLGAGVGAIGGLDVYLSRHVGVQVSYGGWRTDVAGAEGRHSASITYVASQPPSGTPQTFRQEQTSPWPAASGRLSTQSLGLGIVGRWRRTDTRVGGTLAGGVTLDRFGGHVDALALTQFVLGGHSTLFSVTHAVRMVPVDAHAWRPYLGGDIHVRVGPRVAIFGGMRATVGPRVEITMAPDELVDPEQAPWAPQPSELRGLLGTPALSLPGTRWLALAGVKLFVD